MMDIDMRFFHFLLLSFCLVALPVSADPSKLPLLPPGQFLSVETGFNIDNPRRVRRAITKYLKAATQAGMQVKPIEFGWEEIEERRGVYKLEELEDRLRDYNQNGWRPLVFLRVVDSDDVTIPAYLKGTDEAVSLADIDISSPIILERYTALLQRVVPLIRKYHAFAIFVANEPDNFLMPQPHLTDSFVRFVREARAQIRAIDSSLAVGVTLSNGFDWDDDAERIRAPLPLHRAILAATDIAAYNLYCRPIPTNQQEASLRSRLRARVDAAKGKHIIIQEFGCPSGGADGFSLEHQRNFYATYFRLMPSFGSIRVTVVFQLVDWTDKTIRFYMEALKPIFDSEPVFRDNPELLFVYLQQLGSIGVIDAKKGGAKPAWSEFIQALQRGP